MPEPERKIEKLLRAFAKRRRAQSGEPFQMHPATRNLLQREVSQGAKSAPAKKSFLEGIFTVRLKLAYAVGVLAVISFAAGFLIPLLRSQRQVENLAQLRESEMTPAKTPAEAPAKRELAAAKNEEVNRLNDNPSQPVNLPSSAPPPPVVASASVAQSGTTSDKAKRIAGEENLVTDYSTVAAPGVERLPSLNGTRARVDSSLKASPDRLLASAPEEAKEKSLAATNDGLLAEISSRGQLDESFSLRDNKTKPGTVATDDYTLGVRASNNLGYFARTDADTAESIQSQFHGAVGGKLSTSGTADLAETIESRRFENRKDVNGKDTVSSVVLASFQVVQSGSEVQVIDGDGSIYSGRFYSPETDRARAFYKTVEPQKKLAEPKDAEQEKSRPAGAPAPLPATHFSESVPAPQSFSFQVSGTNRTLNTTVILNGRFSGGTNVGAGSWLDLSGKKVDQLGFTNSVPAPGKAGLDSRISGTAQVDGKEISIEAHRVAP